MKTTKQYQLNTKLKRMERDIMTIRVHQLFSLIAIGALLFVSASELNAQGFTKAFEQPELLVRAEARQASSMGELMDTLSYGQDGSWSCEAEESDYRLSSSAEGDIKYFWIDTDRQYYGTRSYGVTVDVGKSGLAGLIYGYSETPKTYYLIVVDANNTLRVFDRNPDGFTEVLSSTFSGSKSGEVRLEIKENDNSIDVYVNGENMVGYGNNRTGQGAIGIAAISGGSYLFSDFEVEVK